MDDLEDLMDNLDDLLDLMVDLDLIDNLPGGPHG